MSATAETVADSTTLIPAEFGDLQAAFAGPALDDLLGRIRAATVTLVPDASTEKGRKEIASLAYKVSRSKTAIDDAGKTLVADIKARASKIDAARKKARDTLDALRDEVRAPLTEWEAEQARIEREKAEAEAAERARIEAERQAEERRRREELERRERELAEREEALRRAEAERTAALVGQNDPEPEQAVQDNGSEPELAPRDADSVLDPAAPAPAAAPTPDPMTERRRAVNRSAVLALVARAGLSPSAAVSVVTAIAKGQVPAVSITY